MYIPSPDDPQASGAWNPMARQSSRNRFQLASRVIRWKELRGLQHLADGAMCSCYTAELEGHGIVVVKKPMEHSNETREEIERELDIEKAYLANLRHPHIVRLIGSGQRGLSWHFEPFLVLEYLAGGTLRHLITERRRGGGEQVEKGVNRKRGAFELPHFVLDGNKNYIPWAQAMGWARDMAAALHYMHQEASRGHLYICRDLKPDNVGFTADGTLKIFDFGLAKRLKRKVGSNQRYTMTSRTGTVRYMAPEAFLGCSYNEKVDVYAWSHVVAEMLSLDVPYNQMSTQQFRETVALGSRRPHVERRWPRSIQRLLKRCWDADPVARPSFGEILKAGTLEQAAGPSHAWLNHLGIHHRTTPPPTPEWEIAAAKAAAAEVGGHPASVTPPPGRSVSMKRTKPAAVAATPRPRSRTSTAGVVSGELHHMSARARRAKGEREERAESTELARASGSGGSRGSGGISTPNRFRLGMLHIPFCFFGGRKLGHHHMGESDDEGNDDGGEEGDGHGLGHSYVELDGDGDNNGHTKDNRASAAWATGAGSGDGGEEDKGGGKKGGGGRTNGICYAEKFEPSDPTEKEAGGHRRPLGW